jgi:HSP20 family protein
MANVTRWDPFSDVLSLRQAMDRLFEDAWVRPWTLRSISSGEGNGASSLPVDLYETGDELVLTATVPGMKPEDIDITIQGDMLTIKGETRSDEAKEEGNYHRRERRFGQFYRQVTLPTSVKSEGAQAQFENGVLTLHLPKAEEAKERRIPVTAGSAPQITEHAA